MRKSGRGNRPLEAKTGAKGLPSVTALVRENRKATLNSGSWDMEEKIKCLEIYAETKDRAITATRLNRSEESVKKFLMRYWSTTIGARMKLEAGAEKLADNIVKNANVEESLEVLDRLKVLEKRSDKDAPSTSFNLIIGMPSTNTRSLDTVPVPSQKQIEEVAEAEVVSGPRPS